MFELKLAISEFLVLISGGKSQDLRKDPKSTLFRNFWTWFRVVSARICGTRSEILHLQFLIPL